MCTKICNFFFNPFAIKESIIVFHFGIQRSKVLIYSWQNPTCMANGTEIKGHADLEIAQAVLRAGRASWR